MQVNEGDDVLKTLGNTQRRVAVSWIGKECLRWTERIEADAHNPWPKTLIFQVRAMHLADMSLRTASRFFDETGGMPPHVRLTLFEPGSGRLHAKKTQQFFSDVVRAWLAGTAAEVRRRERSEGKTGAADRQPLPLLLTDGEEGQEDDGGDDTAPKPDASAEHGLEELWLEVGVGEELWVQLLVVGTGGGMCKGVRTLRVSLGCKCLEEGEL